MLMSPANGRPPDIRPFDFCRPLLNKRPSPIWVAPTNHDIHQHTQRQTAPAHPVLCSRLVRFRILFPKLSPVLSTFAIKARYHNLGV